MAKLPPGSAHWRDSGRKVRFFIIDYRATFPLLFCLFFPSVNVIIITFLIVMFFVILERFGFSLAVFRHVFIGFLAGRRKSARPWWLNPKI